MSSFSSATPTTPASRGDQAEQDGPGSGYSPSGMRLPTLIPALNPNLASSATSSVDRSSTQGLYAAIRALRSHLADATQPQPLPWPCPRALQVARSLSRRLLRIHSTEEDSDWLFIPTSTNPSPVWSPAETLSFAAATTAAGASWADVHSIYSRIHSRHFTNQDFNLALYAHHHGSSASSPAPILKFISTHFTSSSAPSATLSSFPDTTSLAIYHLTLAHRSTPLVHSLIHKHMSLSSSTSAPTSTEALVHATAADRGIHALLLAQLHSGSPASALVATVDAVYPWYTRHASAILDAGAPARVLCTALYLVLLHPSSPAASRRACVTHLLDLLAKHNPWPLAAYVCVLQWACVEGRGNRSLVPMWVAEMDADPQMRRAWRASAHVRGLVFWDRMQRALLDEKKAEWEWEWEWGWEWEWEGREREWWPWRARQRQRARHGTSRWAQVVDEFLADALLTSTAENWTRVIRLLVRDKENDVRARIVTAGELFDLSVAQSRPALAAVPSLVEAQCRAGMFSDAVRVVLTVDGGRAVAGDVERVLIPFACEIRKAMSSDQEEEEQEGGTSMWARWVALAVDCDWIGMLRGMGVVGGQGQVQVPRVLVGDVMVVLGKRGLVEEATAVAAVTSGSGDGKQVREWVQAFERGAEAGGFGVRAARAMGGGLERKLLGAR